MRVWRAYIDTSVVGGVFDELFMDASRHFFSLVEQGLFRLLISNLLIDELRGAPDNVQHFLETLTPNCFEIVMVSPEAEFLAQRYIESGVVTSKSVEDALHVAVATVNNADLIVSWNFKHIVNFSRIHGYNAVNLLQGYRALEIHSPMEMMGDGDKNEDN